MSLILPTHLEHSGANSSAGITLATFYRLSDLTAQSVVVSDIIQDLTKYKRSEFIKYLVLILTSLNSDDGSKPEIQFQLAHELLEPDLMERLLKYSQTPGVPPGRVFWDRQIYFLLQLVVLASNESGTEHTEQEMKQAVGRCCLMANDILTEIEPKDLPGKEPEQFNAWFAATIIPIHQRRSGFEVLARARDFWFQIPNRPEVQKKLSKISDKSLADAFQEHHRISLKKYYLMMVTLYVHYLNHGVASAVLLDQSTYLVPTFHQDDVGRLMKTISQTPDQLAFHLLGTPRQNWSFDHTPLRRYPLLEVFPGRQACLDQGIFLRSVTEKIYFLLQEAYPAKKFNQMFGLIFEEYIFSLLRCSNDEATGIRRTFYANPHFKSQEDEVCDVLLIKDGTAIVMEIKARLLTTQEKYGGQQPVTLRGIENILAKDETNSKKGVTQLAASLKRLLRGEMVSSGAGEAFTLSDCHALIPVIVTFEESVGFEAVRQFAEAKFSKLIPRNDAAFVRVGAVVILTVREIEMLEAYSGVYSTIDLIREYAAHAPTDPMDRTGSFSSFIRSRNLTFDAEARSPLIDRNQRLAIDEAMAELEDLALRRQAEAIAPNRARLDALIDHPPPSSINYDDEGDELPC